MPDLIGRTIGPYRILEQIGVGGMATVYKAYQLNMERDVALKILPHYLAQDETFAKRFQREAHAIARLEHVHILPVYDFGDCDGVTFIAMRYMPAGTLKERLARGPLPLAEVARLVGQIGGALDYAHRQGVIHRDVKPGNVLVDAEGEAYLTDFGLARMLETSQHLTASGVGVGTPAYMAPEQGQGLPADPRSDLYSLGVILFELVTGRVPFEAETPMAVVIKHITEPLPLPRTVRPDVPEPVEKVILKALAKDPAHRYQSAAELVQALDRAVQLAAAGAPTVAALTRAALPAPKPPFRLQAHHALRAALALVGGLAVIVVAAYLWNQWRPSPAPTSPARPTAASPIPTAAAVRSVEPRPTDPPAPAASEPTVPADLPLRLLVTSSADWAAVTLISGGTLTDWRAAEAGGEAVSVERLNDALRLNQPLERARAGQTVFSAQDGTVFGASNDTPVSFRVEKGCLGTVTVEVFNLVTGRPLLVKRFSYSGCERPGFAVPWAWLAAADVPPTPTAEPPQLPVIYPEAPATGRLALACGPEPYRMICVETLRAGAFGAAETIAADVPVYGITIAPIWSPDGRQLVFSALPSQTDAPRLYVITADGAGLHQLTEGVAEWPSWSPDGSWIAFVRERSLWLIRPDGQEARMLVPGGEAVVQAPAWAPDGRLAYLLARDDLVRDALVAIQVNVIDVAGGEPRVVAEIPPADHLWPGNLVWSADGRSLAVSLWKREINQERILFLDAASGAETVRLEGLPFWWHANFWPRWGLQP